MDYPDAVDYAAILCHVAMLTGLSLCLKDKASAGVEDYFLGGRRGTRLSCPTDRRAGAEAFLPYAAPPFAPVWQVSMFMFPMQVTGALWCIGLAGLRVRWRRHLPEKNDFEADKAASVS